ncbi:MULTISPECIES: hypothetical protein [Paenibacillus]|uniref:hypothetical protein n=1 Tax=Paenibacillus TaxID=44249 RepID=UPI0011650BFC|nr:MULTISPECIES: hypothetical protein [Paenibacillus]AWP25230.1 hypothetical protein B9D94_00685 [Paenibacillus sp. Cedars]MBX4152595.1 hypothetical protein [Paenibacillus lautus]
MSHKDTKNNYHSFLGDLKATFDPIFRNARTQDSSDWRKKAWSGPLKSYIGMFKAAGALGKLGGVVAPLIGPTLVVVGGILASIPVWLIIFLPLLLLFGVYWIFVIQHTKKMATMGDPHFHIGAFKEKRPLEYKLWKPFLDRNGPTFEGLYDFMIPIFNPNNGEDLKSVIEYTKGHVAAVQTEKDEYRTARDFLKSEVERYERAVGYLVDLVKAINKSLYRYANDCMNFYELDFVCAYTIYRVEEDKIRKIHDKGTTGASPAEITLTEENARKFAAVYVAMLPSEEDGFSYNNPFPGRTVAAYRMEIYGETWIWNFHFDDSNDKALSLTLSNDIIEIREVYRLVQAFCLLLQKREIEGKEGIQDGNAKSQRANEN